MQIIKKINNNVAFGIDDNDREVVVLGKGIGFPSMPYEMKDLCNINQTFYYIEKPYIELIDSVDEKIFDVAYKIISLGHEFINCKLNSNVLFTLADHISFALEKKKKNIEFISPLNHEIKHLYKAEVDVGKKSLEIIRSELGCDLPENEAYSIALHFINAEIGLNDFNKTMKMVNVINEIIAIIEKTFGFILDNESLDYSRFVIHMQYLMVRMETGEEINSNNSILFDEIKKKYPKVYKCALEIKKHVSKALNANLNNEEIMYLMLHINRISAKCGL